MTLCSLPFEVPQGITALPPPEAWKGSPAGKERLVLCLGLSHDVSGNGFAHSQLNYKLSPHPRLLAVTQSLLSTQPITQQSASQAKRTAKTQQL